MARRWLNVDLLITLALLAFFLAVALESREWPFRAALFPLGTALAMLGFLALKLSLDARRNARPEPARAVQQPALLEEEAAAEAELEDVFATAPRSDWLSAVGWMATFFVLMWGLGLLITVPLFALLYLLLSSRESPLFAAIYAATAWLFMWGLFERLLRVPLPGGALTSMLGLP